jgi:hypothetical protein
MSTLNNLKDNSVTIVVNSCDAYKDVWPLFFLALKEYWPDCPWKIVLNVEKTTSVIYEGVKCHSFNNTNVKSWGERFKSTLSSLNTDYVVMLYDDFILEAPVDLCKVMELLEFMENDESIGCIYLTNLELSSVEFPRLEGFNKVNKYADYRLNSAAALWKREELLRNLENTDNPWAWEVFGSYRSFKYQSVFLCPEDSIQDVIKYAHSKGGAIYRGKWVRDVVESKANKYALDIDFDERGYADNDVYESRTFKWKLKFLWLGYQMVGIKSLLFVYRYLKLKINNK